MLWIAKSSCSFRCLLYVCTMCTQKSMYMILFQNKVFIRESWLELSFFQCSWSLRRMQVEVFSYAPTVWLELRPEIQLCKSFPKYYCSIYDIYICTCIVYTRVCKILQVAYKVLSPRYNKFLDLRKHSGKIPVITGNFQNCLRPSWKRRWIVHPSRKLQGKWCLAYFLGD